MNIEKYLQRINYTKEINLNLETLNGLQEAHLKSVPFENLDIHYDKKIELNVSLFYKKIVENKRGGLCYELNGLFYALLKEIGFDVKMISARVYKQGKEKHHESSYNQNYDHLASIATLDGKEYLVDVGFGEFSLYPLPLKMNIVFEDSLGKFFLDKLDDNYFRLNEIVIENNGDNKEEKIVPQYIFENQSRELEEFKEMCVFHQTSSESPFTKGLVVYFLKEDKGITRKITLTDKKLKIRTLDNQIEETYFEDQNRQEFERLLFEYFDIKM